MGDEDMTKLKSSFGAHLDNLINRNLLVKQLEKRGATVEALEHGQAAVDRLRQVCGTGSVSVREQDQPFDVVLMDVEMPGKQTYLWKKKIGSSADTPFLVSISDGWLDSHQSDSGRGKSRQA